MCSLIGINKFLLRERLKQDIMVVSIIKDDHKDILENLQI